MMQRSKFLALAVTIVVHLALIGLLLLLRISYASESLLNKEIAFVPVGLLNEAGAASSGAAQSLPVPDQTAPAPASEAQHGATESSQGADYISGREPSPMQSAPKTAKKPSRNVSDTPTTKKKSSSPATSMPDHNAAIGSKISNAFNKSGKGSSGGQGTTNPGSGGSAQAGWSLDGRDIVGNGGMPVRPSNTPDIRGTLVVRIVVNAAGQVIDARQLLKGSNITDERTIQAALQAARATRFNALPNAPNQAGTITYHFDVK